MTFLTEPSVVDSQRVRQAAGQARKLGLKLPTFSQLAHPESPSGRLWKDIASVGPDEPNPANLWRMHWYNSPDRRGRDLVPGHVVLPKAITGVDAKIVVMFGDRFPMIGAHKVLPAYAALIEQLVTGRFDPTEQKAVWPSTGNYCRGGVAVSRILGCRGVAVLPEGMSRERFEWLEKWVTDPSDIIRTPGTESNVKEIYDKCAELRKDDRNVILNQFSSFSNYLIHYECTGRAAEDVFKAFNAGGHHELAAFVSATGSSGTIAAGDFLKTQLGAKIAAVEAIECPTMLNNGYGEHNIQGIGDKHIPLIQNVMNQDFVIGVSDRATDQLNLLFGSAAGRSYLQQRRGLDPALVNAFDHIGISGFANILASIKLAKHMGYGPEQVIMTVATDSAALYGSERRQFESSHYAKGFDEVNAAEIFGACLLGAASDHVVELTEMGRRSVFNLGYYTWVEQQGVSVADFERRRSQSFWSDIQGSLHEWDQLTIEFNKASN
ncbi:MAG: pyridoxal-phosphate dependent enzyme [Afipia sp.]|jgi:cysteine synthase|nr:pyridoxal-phosphate dependent enzyme [Afipia sp.]